MQKRKSLESVARIGGFIPRHTRLRPDRRSTLAVSLVDLNLGDSSVTKLRAHQECRRCGTGSGYLHKGARFIPDIGDHLICSEL